MMLKIYFTESIVLVKAYFKTTSLPFEFLSVKSFKMVRLQLALMVLVMDDVDEMVSLPRALMKSLVIRDEPILIQENIRSVFTETD